MDIGGVAGSGGGAVACPVCTLYLREGISLQRHLDTHPKEQVIEALIKASSSPSSPSSPPTPATPQNLSSPQSAPGAGSQIPSQTPYPVSPVFECPPINAMMPPQFASFSYQQFVNNGTMMIPQYAMAPQANQMMQMLYNPYGMYQQQQIPTVQMISPITTIPTTRIRPVVTVANEVGSRSVAEQSVVAAEGKQQMTTELSADVEAERILPDLELSTSPTPNDEEASSGSREEREDTAAARLRVEHRGQQTQNATTQSRTVAERQDYRRGSQDSPGENCRVGGGGEEEKAEVVEADSRERRSTRIDDAQLQCKVMEFDESESRDFQDVYESENDKTGGADDAEAENEERKNDIGEMRTEAKDELAGSPVREEEDSGEKERKESNEPEVEQLERLLITMMETNFVASTIKINDETTDEDNERREDGNSVDKHEMSDASDRSRRKSVEVETSKMYNDESQNEARDKATEDVGESTFDEFERNLNDPYRYRCSLSAPSSPVVVVAKKLRRTFSLRSDYSSNENLNFYPVDCDAVVINDDDDEVKNMESNFDEEDMEIEDIASPHTPFSKENDYAREVRSRTPLSATSGISGLRVQRNNLGRDSTNGTMRSFSPMDTESTSEDDDDEDEDEDDEDDEIDEDDEDISDSLRSSLSKIPSIASTNDDDRKTPIRDNLSIDNNTSDRKIDANELYHQSVITEHVSSFTTVNSQQPLIIHDNSYPMSSSDKSSLRNNAMNLSELADPTTSAESKSFQDVKTVHHMQSTELLNINEDAHAGPMNVFEFDGLQILVPSTFISESSQKAISATSRQSMASSEGGAGIDEEVKSINMRADETMPPRGELSEQESNGCTEPSAWQMYMGQESSRMSTSYDLLARESWLESDGSDNEAGVPLLDSRSLATHFTSSLFLDRDRKTPTKRTFKCSQCSEVFDCPKERRVHSTRVHKEAGPSGSNDPTNDIETKDIKLLDGRMNVFDDIFVSNIHMQQPLYHHHQQQQHQQQQQQQQQPLLHQLQPPQSLDMAKSDGEQKIEGLAIPQGLEISCAMCSQRFASERSLQLHNRRVHGTEVARRLQEISKCQTCNEEFPSVMLFNAHLKIHPLECAQCGKYFYRKPNFKLHMKRHLGIKPFPCTVCDKAFLTKQKLDEHTNGHTGNAPVKCNLCNETFRRYSNLTQHKNRHHLNIKRKLKDYICHCGEVFHTKKKLAWHKETHDEKPKACTYCNERFIHMASLTRHMRRAHNRRFVPDAQRESENVECPICKCIYLRSSLSVHMRVHNGERPYECQVCAKTFSTKWNLQLHKWTHAARSTKPFKCNQCSAAFYRHSDYTAHMNSHRNVRPYTCNYCGAQFIRKYNCLRHVKEHEENKAYTCDVCNKTFHRSYYLKEHLRVHSGARPYTCHICGKSSSTKSNHNKHVRIHHAREPVNTEN